VKAKLASERLASSVSRVTTTMMGIAFLATDEPHPEPWRVVILPIPGPSPLTIALASDRAGCAALAAAMLCCDEDSLDLDMIDDFLRELANMTAGQIKHEMAIEQALGLPRLVDAIGVFTPGSTWHHYLLRGADVRLIVAITHCVL
jgi:Chemotaxis phosphatase CheX